MGWDSYNLVETIGGYVTAAGIVLLLGNLFWSSLKGPAAGPDPWHGATLEWTTTSPPPPYTYPVIPKVSSAYANWDDEDRAEDRAKLARGFLVLQEGHQQVEVTPVDGSLDRVVEMPHDSPWPPLLALSLLLVFTALVLGKFGLAGIFAVGTVLTLFGWHSKEPQES
jgi:hypothetical protein